MPNRIDLGILQEGDTCRCECAGSITVGEYIGDDPSFRHSMPVCSWYIRATAAEVRDRMVVELRDV